jgi:hypothetical protein
MHARVALGAERDQILFLVGTRVAPEFEVVHLPALHATAYQAAFAKETFVRVALVLLELRERGAQAEWQSKS